MQVFEFVKAAAPFVVIGICLAILFANLGKADKKNNCITEGMCMGMCFGVAISCMFDGNMGMGISLGMLVGETIGLFIPKDNKPGGRGQWSNDTTNYVYDKIGRIKEKADKLGKITYTYDKNGNVLTVSDSKGTITRTYDSMNRFIVPDTKGSGYSELC